MAISVTAFKGKFYWDIKVLSGHDLCVLRVPAEYKQTLSIGIYKLFLYMIFRVEDCRNDQSSSVEQSKIC